MNKYTECFLKENNMTAEQAAATNVSCYGCVNVVSKCYVQYMQEN